MPRIRFTDSLVSSFLLMFPVPFRGEAWAMLRGVNVFSIGQTISRGFDHCWEAPGSLFLRNGL